MAITILYRDGLKEYDFGPGHPFRGDRYDAFPRFLRERLPEDSYRVIEAPPASDEDLSLICDADYIAFCQGFYRAANLGQDYPGDFARYLSPDNRPAGRPGKVEEAARLIVGQAKAACDLVQHGEARKVVALGGGMHHAKPRHGEGFCIYNDVAFCASYLRKVHGLQRVLLLDTDAHAGNGTAEYFYEDPTVLLIDIHQDPTSLYPGTGFAEQIGAGDGRGFTINVSMPLFSGSDAYRLVFEEVVMPVAREFQPQIIVRNGGSDPHAADDLTHLGLDVAGFRIIGELVAGMAEACDGREIDLIGSGYNRDVLAQSWLALICGLAGIGVDLEEPVSPPPWLGVNRTLGDTRLAILEVRSRLGEYWPSLR